MDLDGAVGDMDTTHIIHRILHTGEDITHIIETITTPIITTGASHITLHDEIPTGITTVTTAPITIRVLPGYRDMTTHEM